MAEKLKKCSHCNKLKISSLVYFKANSRTKSGLSSWCRECIAPADREFHRKLRTDNPTFREQEKKYYKKWLEELPKEKREELRALWRKFSKKYIAEGKSGIAAKKWRVKNINKVRAEVKAREAVKKGKLKKEPCKVCKNVKVHAHHPDYTQPLKVIWLCPIHHKEWHVKNKAKIQK